MPVPVPMPMPMPMQVMPPACNSFSIPSAAAAASPSARDAARREQLRWQLQQRPALPASAPSAASALPVSTPSWLTSMGH